MSNLFFILHFPRGASAVIASIWLQCLLGCLSFHGTPTSCGSGDFWSKMGILINDFVYPFYFVANLMIIFCWHLLRFLVPSKLVMAFFLLFHFRLFWYWFRRFSISRLWNFFSSYLHSSQFATFPFPYLVVAYTDRLVCMLLCHLSPEFQYC